VGLRYHLAIAREAGLEEVGELRITEGHVCLFFRDGREHVPQR